MSGKIVLNKMAPDKMVRVLIARSGRAKDFPLPEYATPASAGVDLRASEGCVIPSGLTRSEERRVGKECRSRWSPYH